MAEHAKVLEACRSVLAAARLWEARWRLARDEDGWRGAIEAAVMTRLLYRGTCLAESPGEEEGTFEQQARRSASDVYRAVLEPLAEGDRAIDPERWDCLTAKQRLANHFRLIAAIDALAAASDLLELAPPVDIPSVRVELAHKLPPQRCSQRTVAKFLNITNRAKLLESLQSNGLIEFSRNRGRFLVRFMDRDKHREFMAFVARC